MPIPNENSDTIATKKNFIITNNISLNILKIFIYLNQIQVLAKRIRPRNPIFFSTHSSPTFARNQL